VVLSRDAATAIKPYRIAVTAAMEATNAIVSAKSWMR
jgi:hypothetical protein